MAGASHCDAAPASQPLNPAETVNTNPYCLSSHQPSPASEFQLSRMSSQPNELLIWEYTYGYREHKQINYLGLVCNAELLRTYPYLYDGNTILHLRYCCYSIQLVAMKLLNQLTKKY